MTSRDERDARVQFSERYAIPTADVNARIEREVIGAVWGVNGYTTLAQAKMLASKLDLAPGRRLLDVGTGRGWPGVYFAVNTGCQVIGTDLPYEPLAIAKQRVNDERLTGRVSLAIAAGAAQPFRPESFDAVVHTDVLCWLRRKLAVLRALNRLLRPGGRIAYTTIYITPGLTPAQRQRARRSGPRAVASRSHQQRLLESAGFADIEVVDLTEAFANTARAWLASWEDNAEQLKVLEPDGSFEERQRERRTQLRAIEDGLLRRALFSATRPA